MIQLKKIISIEYQKRCYCGKPLIKNICEIHGTDIRISTKMIHAQFEITEKIDEKKIKTQLINGKLTENQFVNLFSRKEMEKFTSAKEKFLVKFSSFGSDRSLETILSDFFSYLEYDYFLDKKRINEITITNSGVTINYLFNHSITREDELEISFELVTTRNLIDYINWRLSHFKSKKENIIYSLKNTRATVYSDKGKLYRIIDVNWDDNLVLPNEIILENIENSQDRITKHPRKLFHSQNDFFISTRVENQIISALNQFAQKFMISFKQFLIQNAYLAEIQRVKNEEIIHSYDELVNKIIPLEIERFYDLVETNE